MYRFLTRIKTLKYQSILYMPLSKYIFDNSLAKKLQVNPSYCLNNVISKNFHTYHYMKHTQKSSPSHLGLPIKFHMIVLGSSYKIDNCIKINEILYEGIKFRSSHFDRAYFACSTFIHSHLTYFRPTNSKNSLLYTRANL